MALKRRLTEETKIIIAKRSIKESQGSLAKEFHVSQPAISKMLTKKAQRDIIQREMAKLVAACPDILKAQLEEIKTSQKLLKDILNPDINTVNDSSLDYDQIMQLRKYTQSNERELLKSMGVLPTQTTNQYIQAIYQDNRSTVIDHDVLQYMGMKFQQTIDEEEEVEIIDAEFEEVDE